MKKLFSLFVALTLTIAVRANSITVVNASGIALTGVRIAFFDPSTIMGTQVNIGTLGIGAMLNFPNVNALYTYVASTPPGWVTPSATFTDVDNYATAWPVCTYWRVNPGMLVNPSSCGFGTHPMPFVATMTVDGAGNLNVVIN